MQPEATQVVLYIIIILIAAKAFGELSERIGQPAVLGELIAGVVLANTLFRYMGVDIGKNEPLIILAELGVILLLFEVGLESDLEEFLRVGPSALLVALIGVIGPFVVGYFASIAFGLPQSVAIFIGATLTATSVGITARTLGDLGHLRTPEAKIILGAAVIDDVLGLIILAVVTGIGAISAWQISKITIIAVVFLVGAIAIGIPLAPHLLRILKLLRTRGILTISAFLFCLILAYISHLIGLAAIVGAFAAGLVLAHTEDIVHIRERMKPNADIFLPIFFVMVGLRVDLSIFNISNPGTKDILVLAGVLVLIAIVMKIFAGFGVLRRNASRLSVGIGMIPRGEVGLIFATIGLTRGIITESLYAAILAVIAVTTFVTPPALKLAFHRTRKPN